MMFFINYSIEIKKKGLITIRLDLQSMTLWDAVSQNYRLVKQWTNIFLSQFNDRERNFKFKDTHTKKAE